MAGLAVGIEDRGLSSSVPRVGVNQRYLRYRLVAKMGELLIVVGQWRTSRFQCIQDWRKYREALDLKSSTLLLE